MAAAAPARKAAPARRAPARKPPARKGAGGRTSHSARPAQKRRTPKSAAAGRHGVRATSARSRAKASRARAATAQPLPMVALGVVRALPDTGVMVRITRGRAWIAILGVLLTGLVGLSVVNLSLGASQGKIGAETQTIAQENSALRARLAIRLSSGRVRSAAASLGMGAPNATDITYRNASPGSLKQDLSSLGGGSDPGSPG
jgi:hypothetical protein